MVSLNNENFDESIASYPNENGWFVKFFAPWCGHCKHLAPTWTEFAEEWTNEVNVGEVDCTQYWDICNKHGV